MKNKKFVNVLLGVLALMLVVGMAYQFTPTQRLSFRLCSPTGFRSMSQSSASAAASSWFPAWPASRSYYGSDSPPARSAAGL